MGELQTEVQWEEGPRVRLKPRVVRRGTRVQPAMDPIRTALRSVEQRFLDLVNVAGDDVSANTRAQYLVILGDLRVIANRIEDIADRRDLSYLTARRVNLLKHYCLWLSRRMSAEFLLMLQIQLEQEFKGLVGPQTYQTYLHLEEVADTAREINALLDNELLLRLRDGSLRSGMVELSGPPPGPGPDRSVMEAQP